MMYLKDIDPVATVRACTIVICTPHTPYHLLTRAPAKLKSAVDNLNNTQEHQQIKQEIANNVSTTTSKT